MNQIKGQNLILTYDFKFEFYKNIKYNTETESDEIGRLIYGNFDEIYNTKKFPGYILKTDKLVQISDFTISYAMYMDNVTLQRENEMIPLFGKKIIEFVFDQGIIIGDQIYGDVLYNKYFINIQHICQR